MVTSKSIESRLIQFSIYAVLGCFAVLCILPLIHIFAVSLSDRAASDGGLVSLWPIRFTTSSYDRVINSGAFLSSAWISAQRTVVGTIINMVLTILVAYPLSRTPSEFKGRNIFMALTLFALLFSGGMIPLYLVVRNLGMLNTLWALILPTALPIWNVILLMNFFREIPKELEEAAVVDGANHWQILFRVILPLSLPALATLTLFSAVGHWNSWFDGLIYMRAENYPLQSFLRTVVINLDTTSLLHGTQGQIAQYSNRSLRAAQIFVTIFPILFVYPFLQRYFIAGIRVGAVKG